MSTSTVAAVAKPDVRVVLRNAAKKARAALLPARCAPARAPGLSAAQRDGALPVQALGGGLAGALAMVAGMEPRSSHEVSTDGRGLGRGGAADGASAIVRLWREKVGQSEAASVWREE